FDSSNKGLRYLGDGSDGPHRLFVISAGNVDPANLEIDHLARSDTESVQDPAQAWNALTAGAYTEKVVIQDTSWTGWNPLAPQGELSPWSTTSMVFQSAWPVKPEIVLEGGNVVHDDSGNIDFPCDDLCVLTTNYKPASKSLVTSWATSAATAQLAGFCAAIMADYPKMWPETVRGLVVHSAEWTRPMLAAMAGASRTEKGMLLRRFGWGVPSLDRALRSASNAATLVAEDVIHPFRDGKMREIHVYQLPWPRQALLDLGSAEVTVRVTLSYFIEPNPARRGWKTRHRYQSHGLRFELKGPTESFDELRKRLNKKAKAEDEQRPKAGDANDDWFLGPRARNRGSIHSDALTGTAADLAERGAIAVYPVSGWWKELKKRDRSDFGARYALIVSIETDAVDADVWTPIAQEVGLPIAIET
ncbi:MAG: S8 family peptidase, partial [Nannocystaceae bacterium]